VLDQQRRAALVELLGRPDIEKPFAIYNPFRLSEIRDNKLQRKGIR
jgi:hypothetical protein